MRKRILDAAMKLFLEEGFEKVSIRRIAEKIEYSPATIYLYYKDKSDILFALRAVGFEKFYAQQESTLSEKNPLKRLQKHGRVYLSFALANPEYYDLMFIMRGPVKKMREREESDIGKRSYEFLRKNMQECMEAGYLVKTDADVAAFAFWSITHGMASLIIRERLAMVPKEQINALVEGSLDFMMKNTVRRRK